MLGLAWLTPTRLINGLKVIAVSGALYLVVDFVRDHIKLQQEVFQQEIQIQQLNASNETLKEQAQFARAAQKIAEETLQAERDRAVDFEEARQRVLNSASQDDGAVAPVLEDALDFIRDRRGL